MLIPVKITVAKHADQFPFTRFTIQKLNTIPAWFDHVGFDPTLWDRHGVTNRLA
jgi:hypothetical protein